MNLRLGNPKLSSAVIQKVPYVEVIQDLKVWGLPFLKWLASGCFSSGNDSPAFLPFQDKSLKFCKGHFQVWCNKRSLYRFWYNITTFFRELPSLMIWQRIFSLWQLVKNKHHLFANGNDKVK